MGIGIHCSRDICRGNSCRRSNTSLNHQNLGQIFQDSEIGQSDSEAMVEEQKEPTKKVTHIFESLTLQYLI